jgi:hypothetical protein
MINKNYIYSLSPHLFWDVKQEDIDPNTHQLFVIQRVLEYGLLEDWIATVANYGRKEIAETVVKFRSLEKKSLHFVSAIFDIPLSEFRCYKFKQSNQNFWPG